MQFIFCKSIDYGRNHNMRFYFYKSIGYGENLALRRFLREITSYGLQHLTRTLFDMPKKKRATPEEKSWSQQAE